MKTPYSHNYYISEKIRKKNISYNEVWIKDRKLIGDKSLSLEQLDIKKVAQADSNDFMVVWLKNIDRLCEMLPDSLDHKDYSVLDVGCGSGISSLYFLERYNFHGIRGFDFSTTLIDLAIQNKNLYLQNIQHNTNLSFDISDARDFKIDNNPHILFMFNTFEGEVLERFFLNNIKTLCETKSFLLYANDRCINDLVRFGQVVKRDDFFNLSVISF